MKCILFAFCAGVLALSACQSPLAGETTASPTIGPSKTPYLSRTPSLTPTLTKTPAITATFDAFNIQTVTPAPAEVCPILKPDEPPPPFDYDAMLSGSDDPREIINGYLNNYGIDALKNIQQDQTLFFADLTNDNSTELILQNWFTIDLDRFIAIFSCQQGKYQVIFESMFSSIFYPGRVETIVDANRNGIPEIAILLDHSQGIRCYEVYEWDDQQFRNLLERDYEADLEIAYKGTICVETTGSIEFKDIIGNGLLELIAHSGGTLNWGVYADFCPCRGSTDVYSWDGRYYVLYQSEYDPPEYRFQAVQDGDYFSLAGEYDRALAMYQRAITSPNLQWWSPELRNYWRSFGQSTPPVEDKNEYTALSAYSYYRIMLLYILENRRISANSIYHEIQTRYKGKPVGKAYAELATAFWEEYTVTQNIRNACEKAIAYTEEYPGEILPYLGNTRNLADLSIFHGFESLDYEPEDICPFK